MKQIISTKILSTILLIILLSLFSGSIYSQQITGLSGWNIYLDPGHSQNENVGIYGYSEAKKNLRVGLNLRQMLLDWTDIDTVYICRTDDIVQVSLTQRTDQANALGAAHYHSIHSDASSSPTSNSTLIMWGQIGIGGPEKTPYGGKKMSNIMIGLLTAGMRTTTRGAMGDRDFYQVDNPYPYLHVNRESNMASELSEAGFHTNPTQNQLNMNANWKRLEAKTMFWTILKYHNITRPFAGTAVGIVKDVESGLAINGASVSLNGQSDTTDTWASLFYQYSSNPDLLRNGFYYFEDIPAGTHQLQVSADGYDLYTTEVTMVDTFFTFKDVDLVSNIPPTIASTSPEQNDSLYPGVENVVINFTRPMDKSSVESGIVLSPSVTTNFAWSNSDKTVTISSENFSFNTDYLLTIQGTALDKYNHPFDGNGDGIGGDEYSINFRTKIPDQIAPTIVDVTPDSNATNIDLKPVINISFSEKLKTSTISSRVKIIRNSDQSNAPYLLKYYIVNDRGVLNFFITDTLALNETYTIKILQGIEDLFGNAIQEEYNSEFTVGSSIYNNALSIDNFNAGITNWLQPAQSGSTSGIIAEATNLLSNTIYFVGGIGSSKSMQLDYGWDINASNWLIREYLSSGSASFNTNTLLQVFLLGDGLNNKFRFAIKETSTNSFEVSPWYNVNWIGWKLVTWDLSEGQTGNWIGNGVLEPPFTFDSFQITYMPGNDNIGTYYFDDLRLADFDVVSINEENNLLLDHYILEQNYPNPFNPSTQIKFSVPQTSNVKVIVTDILGREVSTLVNDNLSAGNYSINFNASNLASGIYFYSLITDNFKQSKKMILMK